MKWIKVKVDYFSDNLEKTKAKLVNMFNEIGINQIEVIDYFSENKLDYNDNFSIKNDVWSIIGYVVDNRFANTKLNIIFNNLKEFMESENEFIYEIFTAKCNDEDWQDEWKKYFHTVNITDNIVIKPSWDEYEPSDNEIVVEIDPGLAFGTGTHETTSLCVEFLEKYAQNKKKLLDIGCGSGILMLIGKKLGVEKVVGIDIDEKVNDVVLENFSKNGINDNFQVIIGNLVDDVNEKYDLVVSNILVDVLEKLLEDIEKILEKDATVIFSGILNEKEEAFLKKAKNNGFKTYFYFITTQDPTINIKRIGFRVSKGGHNVSEEKIIERYYRTMDLLYNAFVIADTAFIFDNSSEDDRSLLIEKKENKLYFLQENVPEWVKIYLLDKINY